MQLFIIFFFQVIISLKILTIMNNFHFIISMRTQDGLQKQFSGNWWNS